MPKSSKPIVWGPFAAGGTLTAFLTPALIMLTLLAGLGYVPEMLAYERMAVFAAHGLGAAALITVIFLSLWSAAHRLRITLHDFGLRADAAIAVVLYSAVAIATLATGVFLSRLWA